MLTILSLKANARNKSEVNINNLLLSLQLLQFFTAINVNGVNAGNKRQNQDLRTFSGEEVFESHKILIFQFRYYLIPSIQVHFVKILRLQGAGQRSFMETVVLLGGQTRVTQVRPPMGTEFKTKSISDIL